MPTQWTHAEREVYVYFKKSMIIHFIEFLLHEYYDIMAF